MSLDRRELILLGSLSGVGFATRLNGQAPDARRSDKNAAAYGRTLAKKGDVAGEDHVGIGTDGTISAVELTPKYLEDFRKQLAARKKAGIGAPGEVEEVHTFVPDLNAPRRLETLGGLLEKRGHSPARIEKILGGNFARMLRDVWG